MVRRFYPDEQLVPFDVVAGSGGTSSCKGLAQQSDLIHFVDLHEDPVGKRSTTFAVCLVGEQLNRMIEDSVVVWFENPFFAVIKQPHHTPAFDGSPDLWIGLQR